MEHEIITSKKVNPHSILLETLRLDAKNQNSFLFAEPLKIITAYAFTELESAFSEIESFLEKGYYTAGFISYEAGFYFNGLENFRDLKVDEAFPLLWFGIYKKPAIITAYSLVGDNNSNYEISDLTLDISRKKYREKIQKIKNHLQAGDAYQINFTNRYHFKLVGSVIDFYNDLKQKQTVSYSALMRFEDYDIISLSPELFFSMENNVLTVKPMKGTAKRGRNTLEDIIIAKSLKASTKETAENLMIVDLLRNDLGIISEYGSIRVAELFTTEKYETLFQMTSTIQSRIKPNTKLYSIFQSLFPCGSVTGAPKIRSMQIINQLEQAPRKLYTGAIGYITPESKAVFNVAIRTIILKNNCGEMGIGSGITWDSDWKAEYEENLLKARFLTDPPAKEFQLIETMLLSRGKYYFLETHLQRLEASANYFDFTISIALIRKKLEESLNNIDNTKRYKVRLLLSKKGDISIELLPLTTTAKNGFIALSDKKLNSEDKYLFHKTTKRRFYEQELAKAKEQGLLDIIFCNERSELTEGCIHNLIVKKNDNYYTPPVSCGLLNGVYRQKLLSKMKIEEQVLYPKDLETAQRILLCNSVTGLKKVLLKNTGN